jgi:hypothetical protein
MITILIYHHKVLSETIRCEGLKDLKANYNSLIKRLGKANGVYIDIKGIGEREKPLSDLEHGKLLYKNKIKKVG